MTKPPILRQMLQPLPAASVVLAVAAVTLAGAWIFEALGFEPCELCLKQRFAYYSALPLATAAVFLARNAQITAARVLLAVLAAIFLGNAMLAAYHAGVEWKFWPGPTDCTGDFARPASMEDFRKQLQTIRVVRCDEVSLRVLGLSFAGWNVLLSVSLAAIAGLGANAQKRR
jgi:disulfide bond formation protein DsbB